MRVGTIVIRNLDVYSDDEAKHGWLYHVTDELHVATRRSVIRKFLLFKEGERFRPERLEETERNLRALHFLKSASVTASAPHDGVVDITVVTQDTWSLAPETQAGSRGGAATFGANLADTNFLGYGKELAVGFDHGLDRTSTAIDYRDPAFFAPYWNARFTYGRTSDGYNHRVAIRRPFYSFATPWSADLVFDSLLQNDRLYHQSALQTKFRRHHKRIVASFGRALTDRDDMANRTVFGFRQLSDDFSSLREHTIRPLPLDRDFRYIFTRWEHVENQFIKLNFINKDLRFEDFNLGGQLSAEAAVSPRLLGGRHNSGFLKVTAADGYSLGATGFLIPAASIETRLDGGARNSIASGSLNVVRRFTYGADHPSTFVGRLVFNSGWRLDRDVQFFADGVTGLRGYRVHAFSGDRSLVVNLEQRLYLGREVLQLFSPGVVVFVDAGNATRGGFGQLLKLKSDAGIGVRLGLPRTPRNLLRLDLAWALQPDARGRRGLLVSVSSGQAF